MNFAPGTTFGGVGWRFDNSYARLPVQFHARVQPTPVARPQLVLLNRRVARGLGLDPDALAGEDAGALFAGNRLPEGADPIAQAYAGHQFGHLARLGDGRAILLGEQLTPSGERFDIQLKGAGPTPYSRRGDGRAALGPMLREYLISEAMVGLGIPSTRSLAVATTGEPVFREQTLLGAVLTRVAASHLRVGTFEYFAAVGDTEGLGVLTEYAVRRHFPERMHSDPSAVALGLLEAVLERQASLIAQWMRVGFVHGVMNTDNMAISGETIDYGPCAFLDAYDPEAVFSSIDHQGRYAFGNQPQVAGWNLARFAEALLPLVHPQPEEAVAMAQQVLGRFPARYQHHWQAVQRAKLGLFTEEPEDPGLFEDLLGWMHRTQADYTHTFRTLGRLVSTDSWAKKREPASALALGSASGGGKGRAGEVATDSGVGPRAIATMDQEAGSDPVLEGQNRVRNLAASGWVERWRQRLARQPQTREAVQECLDRHNPAVIPRNHEVEQALAEATQDQDLSRFERMLAALGSPYDEEGQPASLMYPPPPGTPVCRTFCGT